MFNFVKNPEIIYKPYPLLVFNNVLDIKFYNKLLNEFPEEHKFKYLPKLGNKYSLSNKNNPKFFHKHLKDSEVWFELYQYIISKSFQKQILTLLQSYGFNLALKTDWEKTNWDIKQKFGLILNNLFFKRIVVSNDILDSRFEFSMMSADGGSIRPHTDAREKIVTLVLTIDDGTWNSSWGGGTEINDVLDESRYYNQANKSVGFEDVTTIKTINFLPNQLTIFLKTFNSWHCVRPMVGPTAARRKTITVNIEII